MADHALYLNGAKAPTAVDHIDKDMRKVLDTLAGLGGKPIETLSAQEARRQPSPADAVRAILKERGGKEDLSLGVTVKDLIIKGAGGPLAARLYRPKGSENTVLPLVVYFHGGGWVIASIDVYDSSPRAMAKFANCAVLAATYRQAPEHKFPAAHDDAFAAYKWALANAASIGADAARIAVMGESAGGNLALNVAIRARDEGVQTPLHMALIYPVAGADMNTLSYIVNEHAKPLNKAMMEWFVEHVFDDKAQAKDPRIDLVNADLSRLPSATIVRAEIDPLAAEGELLESRLKAEGSEVRGETYKGVTHEFFGMGLVVKDAAAAATFVAHELKRAFGTASLPT